MNAYHNCILLIFFPKLKLQVLLPLILYQGSVYKQPF